MNMESIKIDLNKVSAALREQCPFVVFATISGLDKNGWVNRKENLELSVFINSGTSTWDALEKLLPVVSVAVPETHCDVTLLNRVDAATRFRAAHGFCLFTQDGKEQDFQKFARHASLDYRIMRVWQRRMGLLEND